MGRNRATSPPPAPRTHPFRRMSIQQPPQGPQQVEPLGGQATVGTDIGPIHWSEMLVPGAGFEPASLSAMVFETILYASSSIRAFLFG